MLRRPIVLAPVLSIALLGSAPLLASPEARGGTAPKEAQRAPSNDAREIQQLMRSVIDEDTVSLLFDVLRSALDSALVGSNATNGRAEAKSRELEKRLAQKMERLSAELPAKVAPVIDRAIGQAEREILRALRDTGDGETTAGGAR
jgi:hypothetical protein